jgi:hypothetical protein
MKTKPCNKKFNKTLTALCVAGILLGLTTGSVLAVEVSDEDYKTLQAHKKKQAEKALPPHEQPAPHNPSAPSVSKAHNLAEAATNPIANLMQFQVQDTYNWENHNSNGYSNVTTLQAVIPVKLPWEAVPLLITRSTLPYITTPNFDGPTDRQRGFGDSEVLLLATPKLETKGVQMGFGVNTAIPTAGDNDFTGSGKWQLGPSALYINMQTPKMQWGLFTYYLADVANSKSNGAGSRTYVSKLSLQPFITFHFDEGWYAGAPDTPQTYDYNSDKWTWALGAQGGRVMKLGKQPVKLFAEILHNPEDDNGANSEWTAKFNITFLLPD